MDVESDGIRLRVNDRGTGAPVLFLHGWMADSRVFDPLLDILGRARDLRVVTMDLRGHGHSDKPDGGYGVEQQCADVDAVLDACAIDEVTLVGWSLGGAVAQYYAATRDRVRRLALISATPSLVRQPGFETATPQEAFDGLLGGLLADFPTVSRQFIAAQLSEPDSGDAVEVLHGMAMRSTGPTAVAVAEAVGRRDLRESATRVSAQTLVLHGGADAVVPPAAGQWLAEQLPKVDGYVEWPDRGHCPLLTAPDLVAGELAAFL